MRNCPSCDRNVEGEYLNVLAVDVGKFNYCCSDCLAQHLRVPRHIQFQFTERDKEEIRKIVREEIENWKTECSKALDELIQDQLNK